MSENDPHRLADEREREAAELQQQSDRLGEKVSDTRDDWERKRADESVPGAPPREGSPDEEGDAEGAGDTKESETPDGAGSGEPAEVIDETHDED